MSTETDFVVREVRARDTDADELTKAGVKYDQGKAPWHLLPWDAVEQVVKVLQFGAKKYAERNWEKGLPHSKTFAATQRHLVDWFQNGLDADDETGLHPLAHAACEMLFALAFELRGQTELDDRPRVPRFEPFSTELERAAGLADL